MKILLLGSTGMLGSSVRGVFGKHDVIETYRNESSKQLVANKVTALQFDPLNDASWANIIGDWDYVINCIGVIKPFMKKNMMDSIIINSIFPRKLATLCKQTGSKLIHITTDCVFSGKDGLYTETSLHDAEDEYGKSKSLGEPENCMVIRTSIIGPEIHKDASLIAWVRSMNKQKINGFTNHLWNGITTKQYGLVCKNIIENGLYEDGLFHVHSPLPVNKNELVTMIRDKYGLDIEITPTEAGTVIDRTLLSNKELTKLVNVPEIKTQIEEM